MLNKKTLPIFLLYTITTTIFILTFAIIYYTDMYRELEHKEHRTLFHLVKEAEHNIKNNSTNFDYFKNELGVLVTIFDNKNNKFIKREFELNELKNAREIYEQRGKFASSLMQNKNGDLFIKSTIKTKHMSNQYILYLKSENFKKEINQIWLKSVIICIICLVLVLLVGYFIIYLSLKPVFNQINELNLFIKDTTHEIKTPLSIILMSAEVFETNPQKYLENIKNAAKNISNIYDDLVELNLQSSPLKLEKLDISSELRLAISQFEPLAKAKNLSFDCQISNVILQSDKPRINKIFYNLLSNAIKYSFENSEIRVNLNSEFFSIINQSQTISPENLDKIYEKFKRFDKTKGGFGIGLSLVKKYCDDLGYSITCKSQNSFTEFKVGFKFRK